MHKIIFLDDRQDQFLFPRTIKPDATPCFIEAFDSVFKGSSDDWEFEFYAYDKALPGHPMTVCHGSIQNPIKDYNQAFMPCNSINEKPVQELLDVISSINLDGVYLFIDYELWGVAQKEHDYPKEILKKVFERVAAPGKEIPVLLFLYSAVTPQDAASLCKKLNDQFDCELKITPCVLDRSDSWMARNLYKKAFLKVKNSAEIRL